MMTKLDMIWHGAWFKHWGEEYWYQVTFKDGTTIFCPAEYMTVSNLWDEKNNHGPIVEIVDEEGNCYE